MHQTTNTKTNKTKITEKQPFNPPSILFTTVGVNIIQDNSSSKDQLWQQNEARFEMVQMSFNEAYQFCLAIVDDGPLERAIYNINYCLATYKVDDKSVHAYFLALLGRCEMKKPDYPKALEHLKKSLDIQKTGFALNLLGSIKRYTNEIDCAINYFKEAVNLGSKNSLDNLIDIYLLNNDYNTALKLLENNPDCRGRDELINICEFVLQKTTFFTGQVNENTLPHLQRRAASMFFEGRYKDSWDLLEIIRKDYELDMHVIGLHLALLGPLKRVLPSEQAEKYYSYIMEEEKHSKELICAIYNLAQHYHEKYHTLMKKLLSLIKDWENPTNDDKIFICLCYEWLGDTCVGFGNFVDGLHMYDLTVPYYKMIKLPPIYSKNFLFKIMIALKNLEESYNNIETIVKSSHVLDVLLKGCTQEEKESIQKFLHNHDNPINPILLLSKMLTKNDNPFIISHREKREKLENTAKGELLFSAVMEEELLVKGEPFKVHYEKKDGKWYKSTSKQSTPKLADTGSTWYDFIVNEQGDILYKNIGHYQLAHKKSVIFAGKILFCKGAVVMWTNSSGHYKPYATQGIITNVCTVTRLPIDKFRAVHYLHPFLSDLNEKARPQKHICEGENMDSQAVDNLMSDIGIKRVARRDDVKQPKIEFSNLSTLKDMDLGDHESTNSHSFDNVD